MLVGVEERRPLRRQSDDHHYLAANDVQPAPNPARNWATGPRRPLSKGGRVPAKPGSACALEVHRSLKFRRPPARPLQRVSGIVRYPTPPDFSFLIFVICFPALCADAIVEQLREKSSPGSITSRSQSRLICRSVTTLHRVRRFLPFASIRKRNSDRSTPCNGD